MGAPVMPQTPAAVVNDDGQPIGLVDDQGQPVASQVAPTRTVGSHLADAVGAVWQQVNPIAGAAALGQVALHPVQTVRAYGQENQRLFDDAAAALKKGDYSHAALKGLYYLLNGIPGLGSSLDQASTELAHGDYGKGIGRSVGVGLQVSAPTAIQRALAPDAPMGATLTAPSDDAVARAITPPSGPKRAKFAVMAQKVAPALNERGMGASTLDMVDQNVAQGMTEAKDALAAAERSIPKTRMGPTRLAITRLEQARDALETGGIKGGGVPAGNQAQAAVLDRAIADMKAMGSVANFDAWRTMRQSLDSMAEAGGAYSRTPVDPATKLGATAAMKAAGIVRDVMAQVFPEMAKANADYSTMISARKVIDAAKLSKFLQSTRAPQQAEGVIARILGKVSAMGSTPGRVKLLGELAEGLESGSNTRVLSTIYRLGKVSGLSAADAALLQPQDGGSR